MFKIDIPLTAYARRSFRRSPVSKAAYGRLLIFDSYLSIFEYQFSSLFVEVDSDGMVAVDFLGENVFRELVEYQPVNGSFDRPRSKFGVETFVGEE